MLRDVNLCIIRARGFEVFKEYTDIGISGSKEKRPALDQLMQDAQRRRFDTVSHTQLPTIAPGLFIDSLLQCRNHPR